MIRVGLLIQLLLMLSCSSTEQGRREVASNQSSVSSIEKLDSNALVNKVFDKLALPINIWEFLERRANLGLPVILDIGGEGEYPDAINLNPKGFTSAGGKRSIPNWLKPVGTKIPLPDKSVDHVYLENVPVDAATISEVLRVVGLRGTVRFFNSLEYSMSVYQMLKGLVDPALIKVSFDEDQFVEILISFD